MKEKCVAFLQQRGCAIPSTKDQAEAVGGRGEKLINGGKLFLRSMGQIARERAEFPVIFLRQERIRMTGGRGGQQLASGHYNYSEEKLKTNRGNF